MKAIHRSGLLALLAVIVELVKEKTHINMKLSEILTPSLHEVGRELNLKVEVFEGRLVINAPMWRKALSTESQFCRAVVAAGYLTEEQMLRAARRYRLGATRRGGVIFWQMDATGEVFDGKVMYYQEDCHRDKQRHPVWVSTLLTKRHHWADADRMTTRHCLFGLMTLPNPLPIGRGVDSFSDCGLGLRGNYSPPSEGGAGGGDAGTGGFAGDAGTTGATGTAGTAGTGGTTSKPVCVVESEKSAVILSEHFPQQVWLATGGMGNVQVDKFRPLRGRRVTLFPDTDLEGKTFKAWYEAAQLVMRQPFWEESPPITVSSLLEQHATAEQKRRKIDLVDLMFSTV